MTQKRKYLIASVFTALTFVIILIVALFLIPSDKIKNNNLNDVSGNSTAYSSGKKTDSSLYNEYISKYSKKEKASESQTISYFTSGDYRTENILSASDTPDAKIGISEGRATISFYGYSKLPDKVKDDVSKYFTNIKEESKCVISISEWKYEDCLIRKINKCNPTDVISAYNKYVDYKEAPSEVYVFSITGADNKKIRYTDFYWKDKDYSVMIQTNK